jgi:integrase
LNWYGNGDIYSVDKEKLNEINARIIQSYISDVQYIDDNKEIGSDAKSNIYSSINSFMIYLKRNDVIKDNPFDGGRISRPKAHDNDITFLEPEEYAAVKKAIMRGVGSARAVGKQRKWMYRDLLLFQIPIITGVRVAALSQISLNDINFNKKCIDVIDKARNKTLYLDDETIKKVGYVQPVETSTNFDFNFYVFTPKHDKVSKVLNKQDYIEQAIKIRLETESGTIRGNESMGADLFKLLHSNGQSSKIITKINNQVKEALSDILPNCTVESYIINSDYFNYHNTIKIVIINNEEVYYYYI